MADVIRSMCDIGAQLTAKLESAVCWFLLKGLSRRTWRTRCFREAYTGLPVVRVTENQKALNCVVLNYSIPVSEEEQIK